MIKVRRRLTLDRSATYQIRVPGELEETRSDWIGGVATTSESEGEGPPITTLHNVLHRL